MGASLPSADDSRELILEILRLSKQYKMLCAVSCMVMNCHFLRVNGRMKNTNSFFQVLVYCK